MYPSKCIVSKAVEQRLSRYDTMIMSQIYFEGGGAKKGILGSVVGKFWMVGIEGNGGKETWGILGIVGMEPKSCMLFSPYTEDTTPIARGMVYPIGDGTIHGGQLIPYYMKVSIDSFIPAFGYTKLPVLSKADDTITMLRQSVGSFLQWPSCRISRILENTPTSKDKASQRKEGATLQPTLVTPNPVAQETIPLLPALQTPALLVNQQTQASSAVEDARIAKEELQKRLDNFEHVVFRKQPCVRAAFTRWTSRDDETADHIIEVPGGMIAGHEYRFHVSISTDDIMSLWKLDGLNSSILLSFEWGLCKMLQSRNDNRCGFLNPYSIEGNLFLQPGSAIKDYLTRTLSVSDYDFMLAPYAQEGHWVLFVICPKQRTGYILDSKNRKQTKTERTYWLTSHLLDVVGSYTWTMAKEAF
ncbi:ulp1 protease family, C-terminal catalytic domain-containing protein [Artemisia annua]|uniref:Ulp1 protease family, C-terminal catalytic domain-containing protein n=1 Tax=Artemisia annua TaxID=35608 RepID=A0A2U1KNJ7_ARTAN|nr:ulp1 protease family, C-terminal catalytic domain-containing protein [Artemisia annua]